MDEVEKIDCRANGEVVFGQVNLYTFRPWKMS